MSEVQITMQWTTPILECLEQADVREPCACPQHPDPHPSTHRLVAAHLIADQLQRLDLTKQVPVVVFLCEHAAAVVSAHCHIPHRAQCANPTPDAMPVGYRS